MGNRQCCRCWIVVAIACTLFFQVGAVHAGFITGTVRLNTPDGQKISGDWIRVLLTTAALKVPEIPPLDGLAPLERYDRVVSAHMAFYVRYQQHLSQTDYLVASVLTTETGDFKFVDVPPGLYFVVVTFPSMIGGYKVAWQVPVTVPATGDPDPVMLNWANMLLPTQKH